MAIDTTSDAALVEMWRNNLRKSQRAAEPETLRPGTLNYQWGDGVTPIVLANEGPKKLSIPFPCRLIWARLCAGDAIGMPAAATATVDVQLTSFTTFGAGTPLWANGSIPTITADSIAECNLTGWQTNLVTGDWLIARPLSFTGLASWLALELLIRPLSLQMGIVGVVDENGDVVVDNDGNVVVSRN